MHNIIVILYFRAIELSRRQKVGSECHRVKMISSMSLALSFSLGRFQIINKLLDTNGPTTIIYYNMHAGAATRFRISIIMLCSRRSVVREIRKSRGRRVIILN